MGTTDRAKQDQYLVTSKRLYLLELLDYLAKYLGTSYIYIRPPGPSQLPGLIRRLVSASASASSHSAPCLPCCLQVEVGTSGVGVEWHTSVGRQAGQEGVGNGEPSQGSCGWWSPVTLVYYVCTA